MAGKTRSEHERLKEEIATLEGKIRNCDNIRRQLVAKLASARAYLSFWEDPDKRKGS